MDRAQRDLCFRCLRGQEGVALYIRRRWSEAAIDWTLFPSQTPHLVPLVSTSAGKLSSAGPFINKKPVGRPRLSRIARGWFPRRTTGSLNS